jgi:putative pyruvate formate lyase activating enzyme
MLKLQDEGKVHNINLVTPEHVVPQVVEALAAALDRGLSLPIVYNTRCLGGRRGVKGSQRGPRNAVGAGPKGGRAV